MNVQKSELPKLSGSGAFDVVRGPLAEVAIPQSRKLYRIPDVMEMLSLSRSVLYEQIRAGRLRTVTQGRTRLIPASAITDYVALLIQEADDRTA